MRIVMCINLSNNGAVIAETFKEADYFFLYDISKNEMIEKITNHIKYSVGAEIFYAQMLIKKGVDMIVCGTFSENAKRLFKEAGVRMVENVEGHPSEFIQNLQLSHKT